MIRQETERKHKIVVCRDLGPDVMPILTERSDFDVILWPEHRKADRNWMLDNVPGATGIVVVLTDQVDDELLDKAGPDVKVVSTMSVGYDHISLPALRKRGIRLGYTPDILTDAVADTCIMLALMASRLAKESMALVHAGKWPAWEPFGCCGPQLSSSMLPSIESAKYYPEKVVGFLGFGRIAHATLSRLIPFGIRRYIYASNPGASASPEMNPYAQRDAELAKRHGLAPESISRISIEELAAQSDILFVLAPGGTATYHIVGRKFLSKMKPTAVLVNAARGTLVDSDALAEALQKGEIAAAGLDVLEGEPSISADHPLVQHPRCALVPHIGSATDETRNGMAALAAQNLVKGVLGEAMPAEFNLKSKL